MVINYDIVTLISGENCLAKVELMEVELGDIVDGTIIIKIPAVIDGKTIDIIGLPSSPKEKGFLLYTKKEIKDKISTIKYEIEEGPKVLRGMNSSIAIELEVPNSVEKITSYCFYDMSLNITFKKDSNLTTIGEYAFVETFFLEEFHLPQNCTSIKESAFQGASFSKGFYFNNSLLNIGEKAFYLADFCTKANIFFPNSLKSIEKCAFSKSEGIKSIHFTKKSVISKIGELAFENSTIEFMEINSSINEITLDTKCFYKMLNLLDVNMKKARITKIPISCFASCYYLQKMILPKELKTIEEEAFINAGMKTINFPAKLTFIGQKAFKACGLKTITKDIECANLICIGNEAFSDNDLTSIPPSILEDIQICGDKLFYNNDFESILLYPPEKTENLGKSLFALNKKLKIVELKNNKYNWTKIPEKMFYNCRNLTDFAPIETIEVLYAYCFAMTNISEITLNSVKTINSSAFLSCEKLNKVDLSKAPIKKIGPFVFAGTTNLKEVLLPVYFSSIKASSFDGKSIKEIESILKGSPFTRVY